MSPLAGQYKLGAAAVSNGPNGLTWLQQFFAACPECLAETSFIPLHWYATSDTDMISCECTRSHAASLS